MAVENPGIYPVKDRPRVKVANVPTFSPLDIDGLHLWLDATDLGLSDGDAVGTWTDKGPDGYDVTQSTTAKKPVFKTGIINGKSVVRFDGVDDHLRRAIAGWQSGDNTGNLFVLVRLTAPLQDNQAVVGSFDEAGGSLPWWQLWPYQDSTDPNHRHDVRYAFGGLNLDTLRGSTTISAAATYLISWSSNGSRYKLRSNGADETLSAINGSDSGRWLDDAGNRDNLVIGAFKSNVEAYPLKGDVGEVLYYDTELSADDLSSVESYLSSKWGVAIP